MLVEWAKNLRIRDLQTLDKVSMPIAQLRLWYLLVKINST
jgi:hypothetical protein